MCRRPIYARCRPAGVDSKARAGDLSCGRDPAESPRPATMRLRRIMQTDPAAMTIAALAVTEGGEGQHDD
jgi:hypothetical protein